MRELLAEQERLRDEVANLRADLERARQRPFLTCTDLDIVRMKAQGLADPVADLIADLETQPDLVPFQPAGGGQARVGTWLIIEDGHKGVLAILGYEIDEGKIKWTVRAAQSDASATTTQ